MPGTPMSHSAPDPYQEVMEDEPERFAGQVTITVWRCVLITGKGKVPYDPQQHQGMNVSKAITLTIGPLDATRQFLERTPVHWSPEFRTVIRPSIEMLAEKVAKIRGKTLDKSFVILREMSGLWVMGLRVPQPNNKPSETWTTLKFTDVFATREECEKAFSEIRTEPVVEPEPVITDPEREALARFLPFFWDQANKDVVAFLEKIKTESLLRGVFDEFSPEVKALTDTVIPF